jgi:glycosyltransferase involved in cell wall biosynthesis
MFKYNKSFFGGTEYLAQFVNNEVLPKLPKFKNYNCIVAPGNFEISSHKENILWIHNNLYEFDQEFILLIQKNHDLIKKFIFVSDWQKKEFLSMMNIDKNKLFVINNFSEKIEYHSDKFKNINTVKLIHFSESYRGMDILLNSIPRIDHQIELKIFNDFYPDLLDPDKKIILNELVKNQQVMFYGKTPRKTLHKYISESHIFAYPAIFNETFCLAQTEAMSAGCMSVTSNFGALKEISGGFSKTVDFDKHDFEKNVESYSNLLNNSIQELKDGQWYPNIQVDFISKQYSKRKFFEDWEYFHDNFL